MAHKNAAAVLAAAVLGVFCSGAVYANNFFGGNIAAGNETLGAYVGLQGGYGVAGYGNDFKDVFKVFPTHSTEEDGIAGRAYAGFQFTPYLGLETGYTLFSDNNYKADLGIGRVETKVQTQQWDILATAGTPFGCSGWRGDIKGGAAYIMSDLDVDSYVSGIKVYHNSGSNKEWEPAAGASLSYSINPNLAMDISYLHAFGDTNDHSAKFAPDTDLATIGIKYKFG